MLAGQMPLPHISHHSIPQWQNLQDTFVSNPFTHLRRIGYMVKSPLLYMPADALWVM